MALTRKFLAALGIEADKVDEIITAHTETVDALKSERDTYKADAGNLQEVQKELDETKAQLEASGKNAWKVKYDALKEDFDQYKAEQAAKESKASKEAAYKALLENAGVSPKRIAAVLKVTDLDGIELDNSGNIKDADKVTASIKEEWADFIQTTSTKGANTATPPANNGKAKMTKEEIYAIKDSAARQQAILDNHELFGI